MRSWARRTGSTAARRPAACSVAAGRAPCAPVRGRCKARPQSPVPLLAQLVVEAVQLALVDRLAAVAGVEHGADELGGALPGCVDRPEDQRCPVVVLDSGTVRHRLALSGT